jgi:hypothetical protein
MKWLFALLLLSGLIACGGNDGISEPASARLTPDVQALRASAASGDSAGAYESLAELRQSVAELRQAGELSEAEAAKVLAASADVEAQLSRLTPAPTPTAKSSVDTDATTTTTLSVEERRQQTDEQRKQAEKEREKDKVRGKSDKSGD